VAAKAKFSTHSRTIESNQYNLGASKSSNSVGASSRNFVAPTNDNGETRSGSTSTTSFDRTGYSNPFLTKMNSLYQPESQNRNWMLKRGKREMVYYDESQLKVLHDYFNSLDAEKTGTIGSSQLQELFISLGIA